MKYQGKKMKINHIKYPLNSRDEYYRDVLGKNLGKYTLFARIPTDYKLEIPIPMMRQKAIDYVSMIIHPHDEDKRVNYVDACLTILLVNERCSKSYIRNTTKNRSIQRVESTLQKGSKVFVKALIYTQCYQHYLRYLANEDIPIRNWKDFLVKYRAFYAEYDEGFGFSSKTHKKIYYKDMYNSVIDCPDTKTNHEVRALTQDWERVRPVLHLVMGLLYCFDKSVPHTSDLIARSSWVDSAVKQSQLELAKFTKLESQEIKDNRRVLKIPLNEMVFVDLISDPIFLRKGNIFS